MIITPARSQAGTAGKSGSQFTGTAYPYLTMPATDGVTINTVDFTPGARTYWHSHESGQILQVLAGRGLIQSEGGPVHFCVQATQCGRLPASGTGMAPHPTASWCTPRSHSG